MNQAIRFLHLVAILLLLAPLYSNAIDINTRSNIPLTRAIDDALKVAARNPNWSVLLGDDLSMGPYYGAGSVLLIERAPFSNLKADMIAIYRDSAGDLVGHWLVRQEADGWVTQGINNQQPDAERINRGNYVGVVFGVLNSQGVDAEGLAYARSRDLEVVRGKIH